MCSGRVDESFIWEGFAKGAPVILVSGCHIGDCHYINANKWTVEQVEKSRKKMEKLGIWPERLRLEGVSAAEGIRFFSNVFGCSLDVLEKPMEVFIRSFISAG